MENIFEEDEKFNFIKTSFVTTGSILKDCIKFLYSSKPNQTQPIFIGDSRGVLYVSEFKKNEFEISKKTQAFPKEISCVEVFSSSDLTKEKIYFSYGNSIYITNRKCTNYSKIEFDIADSISMFRIADNTAWAVSNHYISKYEFGETTIEKGTFDNEANITSIHLTENFGKSYITSLIGSSDNKIKVVNGKDLICSLNISSIPTYMNTYKKSTHDLSENCILFGTQSGSLGLFHLDKNKDGGDKIYMNLIWEINQNKNIGEIVGIKSFDLNQDGVNEIVTIRSNGEVNIYAIGNKIQEVSLISKYQTGEVLTGMDIGRFKSIEENEIILSSYSGLVFSLTPQINNFGNKSSQIDKKTLNKNLKDMAIEVETLKQLVEKKRSELNKQQNLVVNPLAKNPFQVNYKLTLLSKEAVYHLKIESEFPIEMILMQSSGLCLDILEIITKDVNLNIIKDDSKYAEGDIKNKKSNFALSNEQNKNTKFLCTFKFKQSVHQLEILLRTYEGMADIINCTVIPNNKVKTANVLEIPIKALSLHKRIEENNSTENNPKNEEFPINDENLVNIFTVKGKFTTSEMNQIISAIIPDIPEKTSKDNLKYFIKSTFLNTILELHIDIDICKIKSIYLSPIVIIKEQITKEADFRRKDFEFSIQIKTLSIFKVLELIDPLIQENFNLDTDYKIIQAFKELGINESGNFLDNKNSVSLDLPDEYKKILNRSQEVIKKYENRKINLHYLKSLIENLMRNISKVRSINDLNRRVEEINSVFEDYNFDKLIDLFKELQNI